MWSLYRIRTSEVTKRFIGNQRTASLPRHLKCSREDNVCWLPYRLVSVSISVLLIYTVYWIKHHCKISESISIASIILVMPAIFVPISMCLQEHAGKLSKRYSSIQKPWMHMDVVYDLKRSENTVLRAHMIVGALVVFVSCAGVLLAD